MGSRRRGVACFISVAGMQVLVSSLPRLNRVIGSCTSFADYVPLELMRAWVIGAILWPKTTFGGLVLPTCIVHESLPHPINVNRRPVSILNPITIDREQELRPRLNSLVFGVACFISVVGLRVVVLGSSLPYSAQPCNWKLCLFCRVRPLGGDACMGNWCRFVLNKKRTFGGLVSPTCVVEVRVSAANQHLA